jgi:ATP-binding cassette, subfamily C (CFTR/MRP), member 1
VATLIFSLPPLMGAMGCLDRIREYLMSDSHKDHRFLLPGPASREHGSQSFGIEESQGIQLQKMSSGRVTATRGQHPVRLVDASFSWSIDGPPVVRDISFELQRGSLTMLVGAVGMGKSTLLRGVLGEIAATQGFVYINAASIAFVQQNPWIQHKTIRDSILGTSLFDQSWYEEVIYACALNKDLDELPRGDMTKVGSAGHSLSGGQRHRVVRYSKML